MTQWRVAQADVLDFSADGLLCSANPSLNLSGGVGGAFLRRYGDAMQQFLHQYLRDRDLRYISPGRAVVAPACGSRFVAVAHAVAIDAFYDTTAEIILAAYRDGLTQLAACGCRTVASACIGCGYGRFPADQFAAVVQRLADTSCAGISHVTLVTSNGDLADRLRETLGPATA